MQKQNIIIAISTLTLFTLLGFQNCSSGTQFAGVPGGTVGENTSSSNKPPTDPNEKSVPLQCEFQGQMYDDQYSIEAYQFAVVASNQECVMETRICQNGHFTGSFVAPGCSKTPAPPMQLSASHFPGSRNFRISTIGLSLSGVACKIQFERATDDWVDIGGSERSCENNFENVNLQLPGMDDWANQRFDGQGVRLRLVNSANSAIIGFFPETLKCYSSAGSLTSSPNQDENCNYKWDDTGPNLRWCRIDNPSKAYGASYNCPATILCDGTKTATFTNIYWQNISDLYSDMCQTSTHSRALSWGNSSQNASGVLTFNELYPAGCQQFGSGNFLRVNPSGWDESECEYTYQDGVIYY